MMRRLKTIPALVILGTVTWRAFMHPVDTYGDSGAGYIEHLERIRVLERLMSASGTPADRLSAADGLYPPGLHILSAPASFLGAHDPVSVTILGGVWLILLALAVAITARTVHESATIPAFLTTFCIPALHAVAPRYYYDLPMTTLIWAAVAVLAWSHLRPIRRSILAGLLFSAACFIKWSALPLGLPLVLAGILFAARHHKRRALVTSLGFTLTTALVVVPILLASNSFGSMGGATFQPPPGVPLPQWTTAIDQLRPGLGHALGSMMLQASQDGATRALFYAHRLATTILAPVLLPFSLAILALWMRRRAPALLPVVCGVVPVFLFVLLAVPPTDERFLLTIVPMLPLITGVALAEAPKQVARPLILVGSLVAVAIAIDFHVGSPRPGPETPATTGHEVPLRWGLSTAIDRRGWARADDLPDHRVALRDRLLRTVEACRATSITGDDALVSDKGDLNWWAFAFERAQLADGAPARHFRPFHTELGPLPVPPTLAFSRDTATPPIGLTATLSTLPFQVWAAPGSCTAPR